MVKSKKIRSSFFSMMIIFVVILISSCILSLIGFGGDKSYIANGSIETTLVTVRNPLSVKGISAILSNSVSNFINFTPLMYLLISLIGIGVLDKSGLLDVIVKPFKNLKFNIIIFMTFFLSIIFTWLGDYSYVLLLPLVALLYRKIGKNPIIGIIVCFIALTACSGANVIFNYDDHYLGVLTQASASLEVDKNYKFVISSTLFIMIASSIILSIIGTIITRKNLESRMIEAKKYENDEVIYSKKGFAISLIAFIVLNLIIIYFILPIKLPGAGMLLGSSKSYMERLFSNTSPFKNSFLVLNMFVLVITGTVYGFISKNFKNSQDLGNSLSSYYEFIGIAVVYSFLVSQITSIISWTRLGEVIAYNLVEFMNTLEFSGIPLVIVFFIIVILISILLPDMYGNWAIISPTIVPLFMRSNITPDFTQFIFKAADGIGKCFTPLFGYFVITFALISYYKKDEIGIFGLFKKTMPLILTLLGVWILILIGWYIIGLPLGAGSYTTL